MKMLNKIQIKVCGITDINQALALASLGVGYIGFIFYIPSKRYVLNSLQLSDLKSFTPAHAKKVGVFVNEPIESLVNIIAAAGLDMVQLHGDEEELYYSLLKTKFNALAQEGTINNKQVEVIKVFRVGDKMPELTPFENLADYYLFDTDSKMYGGTGAHFNWELLKGNAINKPFFLSGGIGPNDIGGIEVMKQTKSGKDLLALDINSQFETAPGIKNIEKIKTFIDALI
jgi:phosphoribosylanthranilate isomerase